MSWLSEKLENCSSTLRKKFSKLAKDKVASGGPPDLLCKTTRPTTNPSHHLQTNASVLLSGEAYTSLPGARTHWCFTKCSVSAKKTCSYSLVSGNLVLLFSFWQKKDWSVNFDFFKSGNFHAELTNPTEDKDTFQDKKKHARMSRKRYTKALFCQREEKRKKGKKRIGT